jgi:hypothetical protein
MLPVGSLATRTNLLSVMAMTGAALCIYLTVERSLSTHHMIHRKLAGVIAGWAFGTSDLVWSQAVITEVYALHALFVAFVLYLISDPTLTVIMRRKLFVIGLTLGLALGNHVTMLLLLPAIVLTIVMNGATSSGNRHIPWGSQVHIVGTDLFCLISGLGLGLSVYLLLPVWASTQPAVNWGNPVVFKNFLWLITGESYQQHLIDISRWSALAAMQTWVGFIFRQFGAPGIFLALIGIVVAFVPNRVYLVSIWTALSVSIFALSYDVVDWTVHFLPLCVVFSLWIGFGFAQIVEAVSVDRRFLEILFSMLCIAYFAGSTMRTWKRVDASWDRRAEDFGRNVMRDLPEHSIVFVDEDRTVFALWYFHYALHQRPDIVVVATDLLSFDWYRDTLRANYPSLQIPTASSDIWMNEIVQVNPNHTVCYAYYYGEVVLSCR